jgi:hypothetical protein
MKHFLLIYDRARGLLLERPKAFDDSKDAMRERNARELAELQNPQVEVVVLGAQTLDDLMHTHSRYFLSADALIRSAS